MNENNIKNEFEKKPTSIEGSKSSENGEEDKMEKESSQLDKNLVILENEITEIGGPEGLEEIWSQIDQDQKEEILSRVEKFNKISDSGKDAKDSGTWMLNPTIIGEMAGQADSAVSKGAAALLASAMYFSGVLPVSGGVIGGVGSMQKAYGSLRSKIEKRKLEKLEKKYQD